MQSARRRYRIVSIVLSVALGAFVALSACSDYGEGERCETNNNNDDCASPLRCLDKAQINTPYNSSDRCCPVDRLTATHPACTQQQSPIGGDSAPPPDTGPSVDATTDSADTSTGVDASPPVDAADASDANEGG